MVVAGPTAQTGGIVGVVAVGEEEGKPNECTPWETILGYFLKVYDYRLDQYEPKLINVWIWGIVGVWVAGSQGGRVAEV